MAPRPSGREVGLAAAAHPGAGPRGTEARGPRGAGTAAAQRQGAGVAQGWGRVGEGLVVKGWGHMI